MSQLDEATLEAFRAELKKTAAPNWHSIAGGLGSGMGMGAALGAIGGAGVGAVKDFRAARERGEGVGSAVAEGVGGAIGGIGRGAVVGAGLGAGAGALAGHLKPNMAQGLLKGDTPVLSSAARFGQRQLHGLTGWTPKEGLESIRGGMHEATGRLQAAKDAVTSAANPKVLASAQKELGLAEKGHAAAQKVNEMGLTSLPGIAKSMKNNGVLNTIKADAANQWSGAGLGTKALLMGMPAMGAVGAVAGQEMPTGEGKAERVGENVGQMAGGFIGSAVPLVGQSLIGMPLGYAGKMVGRGVDRLRGRRPGQEDGQ
jgi:hypothetical protein